MNDLHLICYKTPLANLQLSFTPKIQNYICRNNTDKIKINLFIMENDILNQFCIGDEFALHEFQLEYIDTKTDKNGINYDYYKFKGKMFKEKIKEIVLAYNCDVLRGIFVTLKS